MNRTLRLKITKYTVYTLILLLLYLLQSVPGLFVFFGVKPIWLLPAAIVISMFEGEFIGGIFGALAGLLCDMHGPSLFGFYGFFFCVFSIATGLLIEHLMHPNLRNAILYVFFSFTISNSIEYLFLYGIWGYENAWKIYLYIILPTLFLTLASLPIVFFAIRAISNKFSTEQNKL